MEIKTLSNQRGIISIYDGNKYLIYSEVYGVVAESTEIKRTDEQVIINFDICYWLGYWDLKTIITKGIKKLEQRFLNRDVKINYKVDYNHQMSLNKNLEIKAINY